MDEWFVPRNAALIPSPALLVYPDRIEQNLQRMIDRVGGDVSKLRPHVKTHKLPQIVAMKRQFGIHKFKTATIAEAEMTAASGGEDVLLAYQPTGPNISRLLELIKKFPQTQFSAIVDDLENLRNISGYAADRGLEVPLYVDLNVGMNRTGILPERADKLYFLLCELPGVLPAGLHAYDGHLHAPDLNELKRRVTTSFTGVWKLRDRLLQQGLPVPKIIASGTPTFSLLAAETDVEVSCGTTVLWDFGQTQISPDLDFLNAAVLLTRVISKPTGETLCLDLGHKAVAAEMPHPRVQLLGLERAEVVLQSEEHLVVKTDQADSFQVGDEIYGYPRHICPTVALHQEVWVVRDGIATETWPVMARSRKLTV